MESQRISILHDRPSKDEARTGWVAEGTRAQEDSGLLAL